MIDLIAYTATGRDCVYLYESVYYRWSQYGRHEMISDERVDKVISNLDMMRVRNRETFDSWSDLIHKLNIVSRYHERFRIREAEERGRVDEFGAAG